MTQDAPCGHGGGDGVAGQLAYEAILSHRTASGRVP
jgi:hypothetical protein